LLAANCLPASVKINEMYSNIMIVGRIGKQPESRQFGDKYWGNLNQRAGKGALIVCSGSLESYKTDAGETRWQVNVRDIRVLNSGTSEPAANPVDALSEKFGEVKTVPMPAAAGAAANNSQSKPQNDDELPF
jgi:single-stranded DNA-binding protein